MDDDIVRPGRVVDRKRGVKPILTDDLLMRPVVFVALKEPIQYELSGGDVLLDSFEVDMMAVPMPPSTLGISPAFTYVRRPGRETRSIPLITGLRSSVYFRTTRSTSPTRAGSVE